LLGQGSATVEGETSEPNEASRPLVTGDHVVAGERTYVIIVR
jgi:hypothetical protein